MDSEKLTKIINDWLKSEKYTKMIQGSQYYLAKNDIQNREFFFYSINDARKKDRNRANIKIPNTFFQILVDQKVSYCLANDVVVEDFESSIDINESIDETAEEACQKSVGWTYVYLDEFGEIKTSIIESENIIDLRDGTIEDRLVGIIRLYEQEDDKKGIQKFAEYWTKDGVLIYKLKDDLYQQIEERSHLNNNVNWGVIPFVPLYNNRYETTDLEKIKPLIDAYDLVISDFSNNFADFQELILFIKNYAENVATEAAASELMDWIKKYKVISVKQDGDMDIISREVPYEARKEFLQILKKNIFLFDGGVDMDELKGGSLTNVAIKAHFSGLDMKANKFIKKCRQYVKELLKFTNIMNSLNNKQREQAINQATITFNKSIMINELEIIESCAKSEGIISKRTIVANHPWVNDVDEELKQLEEDELMYNNETDLVGVNDEV
jgi:SPP1 family phage portal protein